MTDRKRKLIKQIYLYRDSHLPKDGWIQSCMNCYSNTERKILFHTIHQNKGCYCKYWEFYAHPCNNCKQRLLQTKNVLTVREQLKFQKSCYDYMKNLYPYLFEKDSDDESLHNSIYENSFTSMEGISEEIYL